MSYRRLLFLYRFVAILLLILFTTLAFLASNSWYVAALAAVALFFPVAFLLFRVIVILGPWPDPGRADPDRGGFVGSSALPGAWENLRMPPGATPRDSAPNDEHLDSGEPGRGDINRL